MEHVKGDPERDLPVLHFVWYMYLVRYRIAENPLSQKIPLIFSARGEAASPCGSG